VTRRTIIAIKGTKEWGEWLASASKISGVPAAVLVVGIGGAGPLSGDPGPFCGHDTVRGGETEDGRTP
jgi:hypothetical protein